MGTSREKPHRRLEVVGFFVLTSSPRNGGRFGSGLALQSFGRSRSVGRRFGISIPAVSSYGGDDAIRPLSLASRTFVRCEPWFYKRLVVNAVRMLKTRYAVRHCACWIST